MKILLIISLLIGLFVILLLNIIEYFILGDRGKNKNIANYYRQLRASENKKTKRLFSRDKGKNFKYSTVKDYYAYIFPSCLAIFIISNIIFKSLFMAVVLCSFGFLTPEILFERSRKKINEVLVLQLRDALNSITSSLKAGLSLNSAVIKCVDDLERVHIASKEKYILQEFRKIRFDLNTGMSVEDSLKGFRDRMKVEDAEDFVNSILIVRQKGGNLVEVVDNVTKIINDKIAIRNEISILTAGKKMEAKILTVTPIALIMLLSLFSPNYMETMLNSTLGKLLIILGFIMIGANYYVCEKIVNINV